MTVETLLISEYHKNNIPPENELFTINIPF